MIIGKDVIDALVEAETKRGNKRTKAACRAAASRRLNRFVDQQAKVDPDKSPTMIKAGIKAQVTRRLNAR